MSIAARAKEAANSFEEWKDSAFDSSDIENQMFRFNLWTFNNYVFESPRASMDWRLRNTPLLLSTMEDLLEDLNTSLLDRIKASLQDSTEYGIVGPEFESVEAILDQLFRFSRAIRRSGILHRLVKIANHIEYDADGVNLTATFHAGISRLVEHYLKGCTASEELRDRLVETICLRRQNFSYLKAQRESRSSRKPTKIPTQAASRARSTLTSSFSINMPVFTATRKIKPIDLDPIPELRQSVMTATTAQVENVPINHSIQSSVSTDQQQRDNEEDALKLELPRPPEIPFGLREWECPYCLIVCPVEDFNLENWTKHILADIMPYICLLDSCPLSNSLFRSKKDWLNHMKNEHTAQSWTCLDSTHDTKLSFQTQDEFEQHMRDEHEGQFEEADLEDLIEVCLESRTTTVKFNDCPFCPDSMNTIPGDWTQHIAQHLLAFSRMSFDGYMEGEDKASDFSQSIDSSDVSGAQVLSKTIADELRAMPLDTDKVHDYDLAFGPSENRSRLETESEIEEAALLMSLLGSNEYDAARDLIEEKDEHWDTSIFPDNSSIIRTILEDPGAQLAQERATELRETLLDGYENSYNPMVAPEISEAPPDIEEKTWEFYSFRPNFNQYDASMDPIIRSFSKNLGLPEEERADEINQTLELQVSGVPDPDTNPCIEGKPSRIEDDSSNLSSPVRTSLDQPVPTPEGLNKDHKMGSTSVSDLIIRFLEQQDRLFHAEIPFLTSGSPVQLSDELQRFRLWTTEIGILRAGYISLESRLEDSPDIKEQIIWHLSKLEEAMSVIVSQPIPEPDHISSRGAKENDDSSRLAVFSTYKLVQATIDALFQLSLYLDQKSEIGPFEPSDRQHVKEKYPHASKEITNRLGLANAQRRFQMWRLKRRNIMLDRGLEQISISWGDDASSHSSRTVKSTPEEATNMTRDDLEWHVPPPPIPIALSDSSKETILECPYCFSMTAIRTVKDWARHIFNDLMPYVCVYPKCPVPQQMFQSRRQWFLHMATEHLIKENPDLPRKCPLCLSSLWSEIFEKHVGRHLEELALFALPVIEKEDDYGASSTSSDVGMTPPVLFTAHDDHDVGEDEDSQDLHSSGLIQRCPVCHDLLIDMKAHILAHQIGGLEKCPVSNCKYHVTGFVHGHDRDRHILTHYTGDSFYCDFCFQSGTSDTTRFPRVGTFKNHLISVHGVAGDEPFDSYINQANDSPGRCCICNISYSNPHSLYDHLEECVRLKVLRDILPEDLDLSPVLEWEDNGSQSEAHENATASLRSPLDAEATDPRAEGYLSSDPNLQHIEDGGVFEQVSDLSRHRRGNLGALPSQTDANTSFKPDSPVNPLFTTLGREIITSKHRLLKHRPGEDDHDVIFIIHKLRKDPQYIGNLHALFFDSSSIEDGIVTIGMLRRAAAMKLRTTSEDAICMSHNGKPLSYDLMSCREAGLEHNSEVLCKVTNEGPSMQCQISDPETISWLDRLQTQDEVEQDVAKAKRDAAVDYEHGSAPFPAQQSIPEIPDLSSIPSPMEKVTAYKSYFQQELVPICLEYVDRPTTAREPRFYDTRLMRVLHNVLQLLKILNEMNHKRDMQSILACQTLKSQVKRASEQLIEARGT